MNNPPPLGIEVSDSAYLVLSLVLIITVMVYAYLVVAARNVNQDSLIGLQEIYFDRVVLLLFTLLLLVSLMLVDFFYFRAYGGIPLVLFMFFLFIDCQKYKNIKA